MEITRRTILAAGAATAAAAIFPRPHVARAALPLSQPALPFAEADLAPVISAKTVGLHYGKHHKAYYDKLNTLAAGTRYADMELDRIVVEAARSKEAADVKIVKRAVDASDTVFGTGWVWLTRDDSGLALIGYEDGNNPVAVGRPAYLGIDIWEHAYYVDYENRKAEHIRAVPDKLVNWRVVEERMKA